MAPIEVQRLTVIIFRIKPGIELSNFSGARPGKLAGSKIARRRGRFLRAGSAVPVLRAATTRCTSPSRDAELQVSRRDPDLSVLRDPVDALAAVCYPRGVGILVFHGEHGGQ